MLELVLELGLELEPGREPVLVLELGPGREPVLGPVLGPGLVWHRRQR